MFKLLFLIISIPLVLFSQNGDQCIEKIKKQMQEGFSFINLSETNLDDQTTKLNTFLSKGKLLEEQYKKIVEDSSGNVTELGIERKYKIADEILFLEMDVSDEKTSDNQGIITEIVIEGTLVKKDLLSLNLKQTFNVGKDCNIKFHSSEIINFKRHGDEVDANKVVYFHDGSTDADSVIVRLECIENSRILDDLHVLIDNSFETCSKRVFLNFDVTDALIEIIKLSKSKSFNPVKKREDNFFNYAVTVSQYSKKMFDFGTSIASDASYCVVNFPDFGFKLKYIDKDMWQNSDLQEKSKRVIIKGFQDDDFEREGFKYYITTDRKIPYSNIDKYIDIQSVSKRDDNNSYKYTVISKANIAPEKSILLNSSLTNGDKEYLKETKFLQTSLTEVKKMVQVLKKGFRGTRREMAEKILAMVHERIDYDYDMLDNDTVRPLTTEDILKSKKGVCQHFSNLYVTLARSVGFPARVITGYSFTKDSFFLHTWVEIKLDNDNWTPIEPQYKGVLGIPPIGYLPLIVDYNYEIQEGRDVDYSELSSVMVEFKIEKDIENESLSKLIQRVDDLSGYSTEGVEQYQYYSREEHNPYLNPKFVNSRQSYGGYSNSSDLKFYYNE